MAQYSLKEKLDIIQNSSSLGEIPLDAMPYTQSDEYYFVSYSHADYKEVFADILRLQEQGINIWYDRGLPVGRDWEKSANEIVSKYSCVGVIFYLSENSLKSDAVAREIRFVKRKNKDYLSINISKDNKPAVCATDMLKQMDKQALSDERVDLIKEVFSDKVLFLDYNAADSFKAEKIRLLKRPDVLKIQDGIIKFTRDIDLVDIAVPSDYMQDDKNVQVKAIGSCAFANCKHLEKVDFVDGYDRLHVKIEEKAFFGCTSLEEVDLSCSRAIGAYAFVGCENLTYVGTLPDIIGQGAFDGCSNLKSIAIYDDGSTKIYNSSPIERGAFSNSGIRKINLLSSFADDFEMRFLNANDKNYNVGAFSLVDNCLVFNKTGEVIYGYADSNGQVIVSKGNTICEKAFAYQQDITSVKIFGCITKIEKQAFYGCTNLQRVEFVNNGADDIQIDRDAFMNCTNLKEICFSDKVAKIGDRAFFNCTSLLQVQFPQNSQLETIGESAFYNCTNLEKITIPKQLKNTGYASFQGCTKLKQVDFSQNDSLKIIDKKSFASTGVQDIAVCDSVEVVETDAFKDCTALKKVSFGKQSKLAEIQEASFDGSALEKICLPASVKKINKRAFYNCKNLSVIYYDGTVDQFARVEIDEVKSYTMGRNSFSIDYGDDNQRKVDVECLDGKTKLLV